MAYNNRSLFCPSSGGPKTEIQGSAPSAASGGESAHCLSQLLVAADIPCYSWACGCTTPVPASIFMLLALWVSFLLLFVPNLIRMHGTAFRIPWIIHDKLLLSRYLIWRGGGSIFLAYQKSLSSPWDLSPCSSSFNPTHPHQPVNPLLA